MLIPSKTTFSKKDIISAIIVFLIALPLCLGIAQASQAPLFAGIISGIIGGIVVGFFSRSQLSVSGPAAGLIAIVIGALSKHPFEIFLCSIIIAGALQLLLGFIKAGGIANYFPTSVIEGMLAGIGLTIIIKEFPNAVGYSFFKQNNPGAEGDTGIFLADIAGASHHIQPSAVIITVVGLVILGLWMTKPFHKLKLIPAGLLVVVIGTLINFAFPASGTLQQLTGDRLVTMPEPKTITEFIGLFTLPNFAGFMDPDVWLIGVMIAVVASIESLLCIEATDKLDPLKRYTSGNSELKAQGIGNMLAGFIGGLPITSVIIRSSANINAGARSKWSTILHGGLLLVALGTLGFLLNFIPEAALSAILIFTGYRLCRPSVFKHMWKEGGVSQFVPFIVTVILVPWQGLLFGVGVGMALAIFFLLRQNMRIPFFYQRSTYSNGELIKLTLSQEVSFLNKASIKVTLQNLPSGSNVIIDASVTEYIDFDVLELIRDFHNSKAPERDIKVSLIGFRNVYSVPKGMKESIMASEFLEKDEVPNRSKGGYKKLMQQLNDADQPTINP